MLLLLWACHTPAPPLEAGFAPFLAKLDRDHDGKVSEPEYDAVDYAGPAFAQADRDHDGALSAAELAELIRTQDPVYFDQVQDFPPNRGEGPVQVEPATFNVQLVRDVFRFEAEELRARGGAAPTDEAIATAAATGRLDSPESLAIRAQLTESAAAVGVTLAPEAATPNERAPR